MKTRFETARAAQDTTALPLFTFEDVHVRYDTTRTVLQHINLTLYRGESVLLAGPSGSGKSTLVQLCAGLIPDAIEATVDGTVWRAESLARPGGIGMVFQDPETQFCMLQTRDELAFGLENRSIVREDMPSRMKRALAAMRFWPDPEQSHRELSGGQKQKLAIAAALVMEPELLVLDEPTSNLDPAATATVMAQIRRLREQGQTMLIIEHKIAEVADVVDRVILLGADGRIAAHGPPAEVLPAYGDWLLSEGAAVPWSLSPQGSYAPKPDAAGHRPQPFIMDGSQPAIQLAGGKAGYGSKTVFEDMDVLIPQGSLTAIVGPNGAGKSTLLQSLAGLTPLRAGTLTVLGQTCDRKGHMARQKTAYAFQNPELQFMYERVADELGNQHVAGTIPADIEQKLNQFGLADTAAQSPYALSQGQKRRLSVAVMLESYRPIYMLDEPTYGQDPKTQTAIIDVLRQKQAEGKTVVITTHDMALVREVATHVLVLKDGKLIFSGSPTDLWQRPEDLRRAHLDGSPEQESRARNGAGEEHIWDRLPALTRTRLVDWLNPTLLVLTMVTAGLIGTYVQHLWTAAALLLLSVVWLVVFCRMGPWRIFKWFSPFILIYLFYLWTFAAFTAAPQGVPSAHFLWADFTWYGLRIGLVVTLRMLSSVGYLILLLVGLNATNLIVGLCQNVRIPPKFAYGILAGMRLAPLFQSEWRQLTLARALRGRSSRFAFLKPIQYSLPLLSMAVRQSERVAVAMEARGLVGDAANRASARTYLRLVPVRWWDWLVFVVVIASVVAVIAGLAR